MSAFDCRRPLSAMRGGIESVLAIVAAWFALFALIAPSRSGAQDAGDRIGPGDAQPLRGPERRRRPADRRRALAGVRRSSRSGRLASADRRVQSRSADADHPRRRICRARRFRAGERRQARDARRRGSLRAAYPVCGRIEDRRHARRRADRPVQAVARHLRAPEPQSPRQARLRQGQGRRHHRTAGRQLSYRLDLSRHCRRAFGSEPRPPIRANRQSSRRPWRSPPIRSSTPTSRSSPAS